MSFAKIYPKLLLNKSSYSDSQVQSRLLAQFKVKRKVTDDWVLDFDSLEIPSHCVLLKTKLFYDFPTGNRSQTPTLYPIDRNKGLTKGNIVIISSKAAQLLNSLTSEELLALHRNLGVFLITYS